MLVKLWDGCWIHAEEVIGIERYHNSTGTKAASHPYGVKVRVRTGEEYKVVNTTEVGRTETMEAFIKAVNAVLLANRQSPTEITSELLELYKDLEDATP